MCVCAVGRVLLLWWRRRRGLAAGRCICTGTAHGGPTVLAVAEVGRWPLCKWIRRAGKTSQYFLFMCVCWMRKTKSHEADGREFDKNLSSSSSSSSLQSPRWSGTLSVFLWIHTMKWLHFLLTYLAVESTTKQTIGLPGFCIFLLLWSFHGHSQFIP